MCERIAGISIAGRYFDNPCTLTPFALASQQGKPKYVAIIYGKNGSGKTSLAQGFHEIATGEKIFNNVALIDHNGMPINDIDQSRVFVFDENYIRRTIKFAEDGLDSVIMLGEQIELDEKIKAQEERFDILKNEIKTETVSFNSSYGSATNPLSPEYHWNTMRENLRQNWSVRESGIRGMRQNAPVREEFLTSLFQDDEQWALEDVRSIFESKFLQLKSAQLGERINIKLNKVVENKDIETSIIALLEEKIAEPVLSERENLIMRLIKENPENEKLLMHARNIFSDHATEICPLCLRHIDSTYKADIVNSISKIFDTDEATQLRNKLSDVDLTQFRIDTQRIRHIDNELCDIIQEFIDIYNNRLFLIQEKVTQRLNSIYSSFLCHSLGIYELQVCINQHIDILVCAINNYNKNIDSINDLKSELITLNKAYAREEVRHIYEQYQRQLVQKISQKSLIDTKINESKQLAKSIEHLNAQKKNIHIAVELINDYLAYIFFDKNRLKLDISDGKYIVICRGKHICLSSLSVGERNVIALCYFLSVFFQEKQKNNIYEEKCLLVLDDPISSFDFDNKIGMYSFLRYILGNIHVGNKHSRCLILTHELEATFSLIRVCVDIPLNYKAYELKEKTLVPFDEDKYNEYSFMLYKIFSYAKQGDGYTEYGENIGNMMRRVLEAYGTFTYKKGIEALSCDNDILATIDDKNKRTYFNNLMYRLVMNAESHFRQRAQGIPDSNFFSYISESEKIRTAKEILVFLNLLNPLHLREHLKVSSGGIEGIIKQIKSWETEMFPT